MVRILPEVLQDAVVAQFRSRRPDQIVVTRHRNNRGVGRLSGLPQPAEKLVEKPVEQVELFRCSRKREISSHQDHVDRLEVLADALLELASHLPPDLLPPTPMCRSEMCSQRIVVGSIVAPLNRQAILRRSVMMQKGGSAFGKDVCLHFRGGSRGRHPVAGACEQSRSPRRRRRSGALGFQPPLTRMAVVSNRCLSQYWCAWRHPRVFTVLKIRPDRFVSGSVRSASPVSYVKYPFTIAESTTGAEPVRARVVTIDSTECSRPATACQGEGRNDRRGRC